MKRIIPATLFFGIALLAWIAHSEAFFQSRGSNYNIAISGGTTYQGPGDIVSGAVAWGSCARVYSAAKASTSTSMCDLVATTGGAAVCTLRGSSTGFVDLTAYCPGSLTPSAACAAASGGSCKVAKLYDQTGNGNDWTQATLAKMPAVGFSAINGLPGIQGDGTNRWLGTPTIVQAQPLTYTTVAERTGFFTSVQRMFYPATSGLPRFSFNSATNQVALNASSTVLATSTDSAFNAFVAVVNGASSSIVVDGSVTSGATGASGISDSVLIGSDNISQPLTGFMMESGVWPSGFNGTQATNMNSNMHSASNGYNF